jgi:hypothetical protein
MHLFYYFSTRPPYKCVLAPVFFLCLLLLALLLLHRNRWSIGAELDSSTSTFVVDPNKKCTMGHSCSRV